MYNYTVNKSDNYEVLLKSNEFYTEERLQSGLYYPGRAVDDYIINFKYDFKANQKKNLNYEYNIIAEMSGIVESNDGIDKEVWVRTFNILDNKSENLDSDSFLINEQAIIDYDYYNNLARSYEENYGIDINSILKVKFNINIPELKLEDYIELDIDISNDVTSLEENYEKTVNNFSTEGNDKIDKNQIVFLIISSLIIFIIIIYEVFKVNRKKSSKERYRSNVKHILKYFDDMIIIVEDKPNLDGLKNIKIIRLEDLVKISEQTNRNIIYYEAVKDKKSNLYVIVDDYYYVYNITDKKIK